MLDSSLINQVSAFVFNEVQEIEIKSTIVAQSYVSVLLA